MEPGSEHRRRRGAAGAREGPPDAARGVAARAALGAGGVPADRRRGLAARALEPSARDLRIAHRVVFTGRRDDIPAVTAALDVAVLPSYREAQGLTILEAMALSRPVVASNVGGIPEMIEDGVTGLLVPPHDPPALAAAIVRLLRDHQLADTHRPGGPRPGPRPVLHPAHGRRRPGPLRRGRPRPRPTRSPPSADGGSLRSTRCRWTTRRSPIAGSIPRDAGSSTRAPGSSQTEDATSATGRIGSRVCTTGGTVLPGGPRALARVPVAFAVAWTLSLPRHVRGRGPRPPSRLGDRGSAGGSRLFRDRHLGAFVASCASVGLNIAAVGVAMPAARRDRHARLAAYEPERSAVGDDHSGAELCRRTFPCVRRREWSRDWQFDSAPASLECARRRSSGR